MLLQQIAQYGAQQTRQPLSDEVLHYAKRAFLDWLSALYPGTIISPCAELLAAHRSELGYGHSSLPGCGTTAFAGTAAWINGSVSHAIEFDDIFRDAAYHPGCPTIAAALAVAEDQRASGLELLTAIVVGYEISTRIGAAVQPYVLWDYAERNFAQAPLLRTAAQQFCVNLNVTSPTALVNVTFRWTEAPQ